MMTFVLILGVVLGVILLGYIFLAVFYTGLKNWASNELTRSTSVVGLEALQKEIARREVLKKIANA